MDSIIFTRIKELCAENDITVNKLETELGMSQYSIGRWKVATSPTIDKISKIAPIDTVMHDQDFVSLQRARERMSDRDKTRMMAMLKIGFDYAFSDDNKRESNTSDS